MSKRKLKTSGAAAVEQLIEEITIDAYGEAEQLWAFRQAFSGTISGVPNPFTREAFL